MIHLDGKLTSNVSQVFPIETMLFEELSDFAVQHFVSQMQRSIAMFIFHEFGLSKSLSC